MERKCISQTDKESSPQNQVNDLQREAQAGTKAGGNSDQHPGLQQSGETVLTSINPRDTAFTGILESNDISIAAATRLTVEKINLENGEVTIDQRRERVKLSCPYCEETVSRRYRFCPACSREITEPIIEKMEQHQRRVIPLDPTTLRSLKAYLEWRRGFPYDGPLLFPFSRQRGWQIVRRVRKLMELKDQNTNS